MGRNSVPGKEISAYGSLLQYKSGVKTRRYPQTRPLEDEFLFVCHNSSSRGWVC